MVVLIYIDYKNINSYFLTIFTIFDARDHK